jgi:phosphoribosylanthranilate isomerase
MKVKICGITCLEDALAALEAGADLLGFNFYPPSPRCITLETCARIVEGLEHVARVPFVAVFVNSGIGEVRAVLETCHLDLAQLCGDESPDVLAALEERALKALRPVDGADLERALLRYPKRSTPPAWLVDAYRPGEYGGTGQTADWSLASALAARVPILLAGGLRPENVRAALLQVRPWGVDVASGVESTPGRKDFKKMAAFVRAVRETSEEMYS